MWFCPPSIFRWPLTSLLFSSSVVEAASCVSSSSDQQHASDRAAAYQQIRCDCVGGDECDRIWMWNNNYDECRPRVICSVSAVTRVGGSRSHGSNRPSVVNTDEETEQGLLPGTAAWMENRGMDRYGLFFNVWFKAFTMFPLYKQLYNHKPPDYWSASIKISKSTWF